MKYVLVQEKMTSTIVDFKKSIDPIKNRRCQVMRTNSEKCRDMIVLINTSQRIFSQKIKFKFRTLQTAFVSKDLIIWF